MFDRCTQLYSSSSSSPEQPKSTESWRNVEDRKETKKEKKKPADTEEKKKHRMKVEFDVGFNSLGKLQFKEILEHLERETGTSWEISRFTADEVPVWKRPETLALSLTTQVKKANTVPNPS